MPDDLVGGGGGGGGIGFICDKHVFYESIFSAEPIKLSYNRTIYFMTLRNINYGLEFLMLISYSKSTLYIISWKIKFWNNQEILIRSLMKKYLDLNQRYCTYSIARFLKINNGVSDIFLVGAVIDYLLECGFLH